MTRVDFHLIYDSLWHGIVGNYSFAGPFFYTLNATPGDISELNVTFPQPTCSYNHILMNVLASTSSNITLPLNPGNLTLLDIFINDSRQNGTATFTGNGTINLSFGNITGVPYVISFIFP